MKIAYFVLGPESSGTRMLTECFCKLGIFGDSSHHQRLDDLDFSKTPQKIVLRRSLPHGGGSTRHWPGLADIAKQMQEAGYRVTPILTLRDQEAMVQSQVSFPHVETEEEARSNIEFSIQHAYSELAQVGLWPIVVQYEPFVNDAKVREAFFRQLGLPTPKMAFHDANGKYRRLVRA